MVRLSCKNLVDSVELKNDIDTSTNYSIDKEDETLDDYGYDENEAVDAIGIEIELYSKSMREARIAAIDDAINFAVKDFASSYSMGNDTNIIEKIVDNHISRVLIVDESYDPYTKIYTGYFDVWIDKFNSEKLFLGFSSEELNETPDTPKWVLIVPSKLVGGGYWTLADKQSSWAKNWQFPKSSELTQFIGASIDAEDKAASHSMASLADFTIYLSEKYRADFIMYVAENKNMLDVIYWENGEKFLRQTLEAELDDTTKVRNAITDLFEYI